MTKGGSRLSGFGLIRVAWRELWNRAQVSLILLAGFWYSLTTGVYQSFVASRLGPALPSALKTTNPLQPSTAYTSAVQHLPPTLLIRLVLVYATLILIVSPFALAGLYGGVGGTLSGRGHSGPVVFFRYAYVGFWRGLSVVLATLAIMTVMAGIVVGTLIATASLGPISSIIIVIMVLFFIVLLLSFLLYWLGAIFYGDESTVQGLRHAVGWIFHHLWFTVRFGLLLLGLLITVSVLLVVLLLIPVLGALVVAVAGGMVVPAYMAVLASVYYRSAIDL